MAKLFFIRASIAKTPDLATLIIKELSALQGELLFFQKTIDNDDFTVSSLFLLEGDWDCDEAKDILNNVLTPLTTARSYCLLTDINNASLSKREMPNYSAHVITLMSDKFNLESISNLTKLLSDNKFSVCKIKNLSDKYRSIDAVEAKSLNLELHVTGSQISQEVIRKALQKLSNSHLIDITIQPERSGNFPPSLVAFDMDSTLIDAEVIDELALEAGVGEQVAAITESAMRGEIDFQQSFATRVSLLEGLSADALTAVADRLQLNPGAEVLLKNLKYLGFKTAIISGGFTFFARHLQSRLDIDYVYANHLDIAAGAVTGKVVGEIIDGQRKAQILTEIARREGLAVKQVVAVGDGANDLPMLGIAGLGIAYRAKPRVRAEAKQAISNNSLAAVLCILGYSEEDLL